MRLMVLRATSSKFTCAPVVISPASTTRLSLTRVSAATRERLSCARMASRTASEIWSATLSGCPSVTDSDVNWKVRALIGPNLSQDPGARQSGSLDSGVALHQACDELGQGDPVENGGDPLGDRHLDVQPVGE